jgi:hypothetical protein
MQNDNETSKLKYDTDRFANDEEYRKFLDEQFSKFQKLLENPEILAVFKRMNDK